MLENCDRILEILTPEEGKVRSRTVVSRSNHRPSGKYPSWKNKRMLHWESPYELAAFRLLDVSPKVKSYREQPLVIRYVLDGEVRRHYPDLLVEITDSRPELWEVKPLSEAMRPDVRRRTEFLKSALPKHGFIYRIAPAEELSRQPRLSNAVQLLKHENGPVDIVERERMRQAFLKRGHLSWNVAASGALGPNGRAVLCRLVLEGVLTFDINVPLPQATFTWCGARINA